MRLFVDVFHISHVSLKQENPETDSSVGISHIIEKCGGFQNIQEIISKGLLEGCSVLTAKVVLNLSQQESSRNLRQMASKLNSVLKEIRPEFPELKSIKIYLNQEYEVAQNEIIDSVLTSNEKINVYACTSTSIKTEQPSSSRPIVATGEDVPMTQETEKVTTFPKRPQEDESSENHSLGVKNTEAKPTETVKQSQPDPKITQQPEVNILSSSESSISSSSDKEVEEKKVEKKALLQEETKDKISLDTQPLKNHQDNEVSSKNGSEKPKIPESMISTQSGSLMLPKKDQKPLKSVLKKSPKPSPQQFQKPRSASFQKHSLSNNIPRKNSQEPQKSKKNKKRKNKKRNKNAKTNPSKNNSSIQRPEANQPQQYQPSGATWSTELTNGFLNQLNQPKSQRKTSTENRSKHKNKREKKSQQKKLDEDVPEWQRLASDFFEPENQRKRSSTSQKEQQKPDREDDKVMVEEVKKEQNNEEMKKEEDKKEVQKKEPIVKQQSKPKSKAKKPNDDENSSISSISEQDDDDEFNQLWTDIKVKTTFSDTKSKDGQDSAAKVK